MLPPRIIRFIGKIERLVAVPSPLKLVLENPKKVKGVFGIRSDADIILLYLEVGDKVTLRDILEVVEDITTNVNVPIIWGANMNRRLPSKLIIKRAVSLWVGELREELEKLLKVD